MKDSFMEHIGTFFEAIQLESYRALKERTAPYNDLSTAHARLSGEVEDMLSDLPPEDKEFAGRLSDKMAELAGIEQDYMYLQGYRDCVRFLKLIDAL